jgi:hypothetical protein
MAATHVKHIDVIHHHTRERVDIDLVNFVGIAFEDNVADVLTKPLPRFPFQTFRSQLGVIDLQKEELVTENTGEC